MWIVNERAHLSIPQVAACICAEHKHVIGVEGRRACWHFNGTGVEFICAVHVEQTDSRQGLCGAYSGAPLL